MSVLISGRFNILHPGHIRLFKFAQDLGSDLVVAVESDRLAGNAAHVSEQLRLESVRSCSLVDNAFIFDEPLTTLINRLRPAIVVKGREHESKFNPEASLISSYGGQLLFSSGEMQFSSMELIRKEEELKTKGPIQLPISFMERHNISIGRLTNLIETFSNLRVLTVGDLITDDYITCEPLGMSQEDPTLVVTPTGTQRFLGGAGIVSSHVRGLGAESALISMIGQDMAGKFCLSELEKANVKNLVFEESTRPTTLKERYRTHGKTLLRVSHLQQAEVSLQIQRKLIDRATETLPSMDLLLLSDFNYGMLPQEVVDELITIAKINQVVVAADSQSSSQLGDVGRFKGVNLLLPTEREARISTQNRGAGLVVLAEQLRRKSSAQNILLKLGADGVLVHSPDSAESFSTDQVEALNSSPIDVAGAGDAMLVASSLTLTAGGTIWEAACLGSVVSAIQVGRLGNRSLSGNEIKAVLKDFSR